MASGRVALCRQHARRDRAGHRQRRHHLRDLGGDRRHDCGSIEQRAGILSLVATGGGLIFAGDAAGNFRALRRPRPARCCGSQNLGSPVSGYPITFAVNGKQYVAVSTGPSLVAGGVGRLTPELKPGSASQMYVFALP